MLRFALRNLLWRPPRTTLALSGLAISVALVARLSAFGTGYQRGLQVELERGSVQMMLVPLGWLGAFNTLLAAVLERRDEFAVLRAVGVSRRQIFQIITLESLLLAVAGGLIGLTLAGLAGPWIEEQVRQHVSLVPATRLVSLTPGVMQQAVALGLAAGFFAGLYPAWRAACIAPAEAVKNC